MKSLPEGRGSYHITMRCPDGLTVAFDYNALRYSMPSFILPLERVTDVPFESYGDETDFAGLIGRLRKGIGESTFRVDFRLLPVISVLAWEHVERALAFLVTDDKTRHSFLSQARAGKLITIQIVDPQPLTPEEEDAL